MIAIQNKFSESWAWFDHLPILWGTYRYLTCYYHKQVMSCVEIYYKYHEIISKGVRCFFRIVGFLSKILTVSNFIGFLISNLTSRNIVLLWFAWWRLQRSYQLLWIYIMFWWPHQLQRLSHWPQVQLHYKSVWLASTCTMWSRYALHGKIDLLPAFKVWWIHEHRFWK